MRHILLALLVFASAALLPFKANALYSGQEVLLRYEITNIPSSLYAPSWVPLITSTSRAINGISVLNTGSSTLFLGFAGAGSAANTETATTIIPASMTVPLVFPIQFSGGYRISVLNATGLATVSVGVLEFNAFY